MTASLPIIGVVGGIGCGKSTVARELAGKGGILIEADQFGHEALTQAGIKRQVIERFGTGIADEKGDVVRSRLGAIVFASDRDLRDLEALVFPFIRQRIVDEIAKAQRESAAKFIVLDAAVMLESGWNNVCDHLIFVDAPREMRLDRVKKKRGWDERQLSAREAMQMPLDEKRRRASATIVNDGDLARVAEQVDGFLRNMS